MARPAKKEIDLSGLEIDWLAGFLSTYELADKYGISEPYVRKLSKMHKWAERDIGPKIKKKKEALVRKQLVQEAVRTKEVPPDTEIAEGVARVQARIELTHRDDIERYKRLCKAMLEELELASGGVGRFKEIAALLGKGKGSEQLEEAYKKALALPARIDGVKKLADVLKTLVGLERQAYGLSDNPDGSTPPPAATAGDMIDAARRVAFMLASGAKAKT